MKSSFRFAMAVPLCMALLSTPLARAESRCPVIRPSAWSAQAIDSAVLWTFASLLKRSARSLDLDKTVKELDGTDNAPLIYRFATQRIGDLLGLDSPSVFGLMAGEQAFETLSIAQAQARAREAYFNGKDAPLPAAIEGASYPLLNAQVRAPSPAGDWKMLSCTADKLGFQKTLPAENTRLDASARALISMPPYKDEDNFLSLVRSFATTGWPKNAVESAQVRLVPGLSAVCADYEVKAAVAGQRFEVYGRYCYAALTPALGYDIVFQRSGPSLRGSVKEAAQAFIASASPP